MAFSSSISKKCYYTILWRIWKRYKKEQPFGLQMLFTHHHHGILRLSLVLSIHLHLDKISNRHYLRTLSLPRQHAINSLLDKHYSKRAKQWSKIKSSIVDTNNYLNEVFPSFDSLNKELSPGFHLVDSFLNHFSFLKVNQKDFKLLTSHQNKLNNIYKKSIKIWI